MVKEKYGFEVKCDFGEIEHYRFSWHDSPIENDYKLYDKIMELTALAYPTSEETIREIVEKRWKYFYLPLKRLGYLILVPLSIVLYADRLFLFFLDTQIEVIRGNIGSSFPLKLIEQTIEFCQVIKKDPEDIISKSIPNDIKTGKVLGKYVMEHAMPTEEKERILKEYNNYIAKGTESQGVSLDEYLETTAICYKVAFGSKTNGMTPQQMRKRWGDSRDCGMSEIKDRKSREVFGSWLRNDSNCGGHPFEIIYSSFGHGIHLYPPGEGNHYYYGLHVTDLAYAGVFVATVERLIKEGIPFQAYSLDEVLAYLAGETWFAVNRYDENDIYYNNQEYRKILRHIVWDELEMLKWQ